MCHRGNALYPNAFVKNQMSLFSMEASTDKGKESASLKTNVGSLRLPHPEACAPADKSSLFTFQTVILKDLLSR